ncbi:GNAT family N-acetyltransferase [Spirosoma soli]|uniref:GNAT family N-acetyltransferase n=1 Tax=Spirosoma soli TaxID=1770529 RepID=A0ABW5MAW7_9BACT
MNESPVMLRLEKTVPGNPQTGHVPAEHYIIVEKKSNTNVGAIRLRLSDQEDILFYAGHIGYNIDEAFRGQHYAAYACLELKSIAIEHRFTTLWITCDPDNWPSRRTCERVGAELVEIVDIPEYIDMYQDGERQKCRYRWQLIGSSI